MVPPSAGFCAINIIIEPLHDRIDGAWRNVDSGAGRRIKSGAPLMREPRITAAAAIRSAVAAVRTTGRSRQKSKRAPRLSIRPSCLRPNTPRTGTLIARSLYDPPFHRGLLPFLVAERKMRLDRHRSFRWSSFYFNTLP